MYEEKRVELLSNIIAAQAEDVFVLKTALRHRDEEIVKLKTSLNYYREHTNQAAELINQATEKKHADIRTQKFYKDGE